MQLEINSSLTNGMIDFIKAANTANLGGFIFGALDRGWSISIPAAIQAKYGRWTIVIHAYSDQQDRKVYFFFGKNVVHELPMSSFRWKDIVIRGSRLYIGTLFITDPARKPY